MKSAAVAAARDFLRQRPAGWLLQLSELLRPERSFVSLRLQARVEYAYFNFGAA